MKEVLPGELMQLTCMGSSSLATASSMMPSASTTAHCSRQNCSSCSFWASSPSRHAWFNTHTNPSATNHKFTTASPCSHKHSTCCCSWACRFPSSMLLRCLSCSRLLWWSWAWCLREFSSASCSLTERSNTSLSTCSPASVLFSWVPLWGSKHASLCVREDF